MRCEFKNSCTFYDEHSQEMPITADYYRVTYCKMDYESCARNMVAKGRGLEQVPSDLLPCQGTRARKILFYR
jgi:hypothetical protein